MFARITTMHVRTDFMERAIEIYRSSVVPAARKQRGFRGAVLLSDKGSGKGLSISLWDREADAVANEENNFYQEQLLKFMAMFAMGPAREGFEVDVLELEAGETGVS